ncbi:hypothetical protein STEG23_003714 [Scotinomys teguina]
MCRPPWFLDPGAWSKTAAFTLYFIFPGICTLSLVCEELCWDFDGDFIESVDFFLMIYLKNASFSDNYRCGMITNIKLSERNLDLINLAKKRTNIIPVIEDARHPHKYRILVAMVDVVFADVAQPDQTRIAALNAHTFLPNICLTPSKGTYFRVELLGHCWLVRDRPVTVRE